MKPIHEAFKAWLQSATVKPPYSRQTIRRYSRIAVDFDEFCLNEKITECSEFRTESVHKFLSISSTGLPYVKSTINSRRGALDLLFEYLQEIGVCIENPIRHYRETRVKKRRRATPAAPAQLPECLAWAEQECLMRAAHEDATFTGIRNQALIGLMLDTGLRTQEVIALPLAEGEAYLAGYLQIPGNSLRWVRFTPRYSQEMKIWLQTRQERGLHKQIKDRLFVSERGSVMQQQTVYYAIQKLLETANIRTKQAGGYLLRHTAASIMLASGLPIKQVQENLGHVSLQTTERYLGLLAEKGSK